MTRIRLALAFAALAAGAALGGALAAERFLGVVPCALCLVERWPWRIAFFVVLAGLLLPRGPARAALALAALVVLGGAGIAAVHVGVEAKLWPSPLPECAAPRFIAGATIAERLAAMPERPAKPCDEPTFIVTGPADLDSGAEPAAQSGVPGRNCHVPAAQQKECRMSETGPGRLPGDLTARERVERIIRVDHAGEYGAKRIYQGQLAVLGRGPAGDVLRHMKAQEQAHLDRFSDLIVTRRVRPTALLPLWHVAGFALGAVTAALGEKAAMACTVAVEEAIDEHYAGQAADLGNDEPELRATIESFRAEELEHRDIGLQHGAEEAPGYRLLYNIIKSGCRAAIAASERV